MWLWWKRQKETNERKHSTETQIRNTKITKQRKRMCQKKGCVQNLIEIKPAYFFLSCVTLEHFCWDCAESSVNACCRLNCFTSKKSKHFKRSGQADSPLWKQYNSRSWRFRRQSRSELGVKRHFQTGKKLHYTIVTWMIEESCTISKCYWNLRRSYWSKNWM